MGLNQEIGCRLKALRERKGETQKEISNVLNVTPAAYGKIEAGDRGLSSEYCIQLADYFGVTCDYILRGVSSENIDICSRTGLEQETISVLENNMRRMRETEDSIQFFEATIKNYIVNHMIQSPDFLNELAVVTLSYCISLTLNFKTVRPGAAGDGVPEGDQEIKRGTFALSALNALNGTRFSANEEFGKFYEDVCTDPNLIGRYSNLSAEEKETCFRIGLFRSETGPETGNRPQTAPQ